MTGSELTDNEASEIQKARIFSPIVVSIILAVVLALASAYYVHVKNEKLIKTETNKASNGVNHVN